MITLKQRLRELSKDEFECLIHQFLLRRFPGAGIMKADGTGGDRGVDSFSGNLSDGPAIWQSKHFNDRIRQPQKKQILRSIKAVFKSYAPMRWTLCVPIDLRTEEHEWFQSKVVKEYKDRCTIELIQGSDILDDLAHNRPLREAFFPDNSISNALNIRKIATGTGNASLDQTEQLTVEIAQQFLEGNVDLEPRLHPVVSVGLSQAPRASSRVPGLVFSVAKGNLAIDYFARNPSTYNLDPISFHMTLDRSHSDKLRRSINTGEPFKLPAGAILKLDSESPLLRQLFQKPDPACVGLEMRPLVPESLASREISLRLVSGSPPETSELSRIPFKVTRFGRKEITLASSSRLPIEVSIKLKTPPSQGATVSIRPLIPGSDSVELAKMFQFLDALERSRKLEVFSLDPPGPLIREVGTFSNRIRIPAGLKKAVFDTSIVSTFFEIPLYIPEVITKIDLENLQTLKRIATGEPLVGFQISSNLVKNAALRDNALEFLSGRPMSIRLENPTGWQNIRLFGTTIDSGPVSIAAEDVTVIDGDRARKEYLEAPEGMAISWKGSCKGSCRFISAKNMQSRNQISNGEVFP